MHISSTRHLHVIHMSSKFHPHVIHISYTCHPYIIHMSICHPHLIPMSSIFHLYIIDMSPTCHLHRHIIQILSPCHLCVIHINQVNQDGLGKNQGNQGKSKNFFSTFLFHTYIQINMLSKTTYTDSCWTVDSCPVANPTIHSLILLLSWAGINNQLLNRGIEKDNSLIGAYEGWSGNMTLGSHC